MVTAYMLEHLNDESSPNPASLNFEDAFTSLGTMVATLEAGNLPLDQAAQMFEQGMALVRRCSQLLEETELRIAEIREGGGPAAAPPPDNMAWAELEMPPDDEDWQPDEELPDGD